MARGGGSAQKGEKTGEKKAGLLKRLFSSGLRSRSVGRLVTSDDSPRSADSSSPETTPAAQASTPLATLSGSGSPPGGPAAADAATPQPTSAFGGRSLMVQVIGARRLRAADSNGLSDPYCLVRVGAHKASTRTELKTLEPRWNETMAFGPADLEEAEAAGRPYVTLRVFDWDLVSADDFLGQAELDFTDIDTEVVGPGPPRWLPLYGWKGTGKAARKIDAGEIQVAAWLEAGGSSDKNGGSALSTLCCPPGTRKFVPLVVHSSQGSLYEEPLIACLAVTLERVEGLYVPMGGKVEPAAAEAPSPTLARCSALGRPSMTAPASPGKGGLFGRLLHAGRKRDAGQLTLQHLSSLNSTVSDEMLAGEDLGDEYGAGLGMYSDESEQPALYTDDGGDAADGEPSTPWRTRRSGSEDVGLVRMSPHTGAPLGRPSPPAGGRRGPTAPALQSVGEGMPLPVQAGDATDGSLSGMRCYVRLVLGRQKLTSFIKKEHANGTVNWQQTFVFATPLPLRDRQLRIELYRTASSTQRGRLISIANVWLHDLLPPGLANNPKATRLRSVDLESVLKHQPGGRAQLRSTIVDTDMRRAMYQAEFRDVEDEAEDGGEDDEARQLVQRLQSTTDVYSRADLERKAKMTEKSFVAWENSRQHQLANGLRDSASAASGLLPRVSDLANYSWGRVSRLFSAEQLVQDGSSASMAQDGSSALPPPPPPPLPEPAGRLDLTVERIALAAGGSTGELFFVIKCGPHWARSTALPLAGGSSVEYGWQLSLPVLDPCSVLTLAVFQQSRPKRGLDKARPGFLPSTVQAVGKLRVRLSCLWPNTPLSSDLPLLGERQKGAHLVGSVQLTLQANYATTKALVKGYTAPPLPAAAYTHGVDDKGHQATMARESRRIVLRWLDAANPAISGPVALVVLDAEREVFAMSRARVNMRRIQMALVGVRRCKRTFDAIKTWKDPRRSTAAMAGICFTCFCPRLAIPALLAWLVLATLAAQPGDAGMPVPMEQDPPGIEPENESLETTTVNPVANLRAKLDRLQRMGLQVQNVLDGVASVMERGGALLSWQDPSATLGVCVVLCGVAAIIFLLGLPTVLATVLCFVIRPPALRTPTPPLPAVVFGKLPTRGDCIV